LTTRKPVTGDDVDMVASEVVDALRPGVDQEWLVPAGKLTWTCWDTAEHIAGVGLVYAAQLAIRKQEHRYARLYPRLFPEPAPADVLESIEVAYRLLAMTVRGTPPDVRAYHPRGDADAEGFAALASMEALVHCYDITTGLGLPFEPSRDVCGRVLARSFPTALDVHTDPLVALLWATGRVNLPDQEPVTEWQQRAAPLDP
jgi:hypothetical protein